MTHRCSDNQGPTVVERSGGINVYINWSSVYKELHDDVYVAVDVST